MMSYDSPKSYELSMSVLAEAVMRKLRASMIKEMALMAGTSTTYDLRSVTRRIWPFLLPTIEGNYEGS